MTPNEEWKRLRPVGTRGGCFSFRPSDVLFCSGSGWLWCDSWADPDGLDVDEFADAEGGEFAAIATALDAAEGQARVTGGHAVYEHATGFEVTGEGAPALDVARPQIAAQAKVGVVCQFDGVIGVAGGNDGGGRAEGLFAEDGHVGRNIAENGWLVEVAFASRRFAAQQD